MLIAKVYELVDLFEVVEGVHEREVITKHYGNVLLIWIFCLDFLNVVNQVAHFFERVVVLER